MCDLALWWRKVLSWSLCVLAFGAPASAQLLSGKGAELPLAVVVTAHFRVLHPPRLESLARHVAAAAEQVRSAVLGAVGNDPGLTYILLNDETDEFNGYATPGPYPFIRLYPTFPRPTDIGAQFKDIFVELVGHEFTHVAHLTTRDGLRDTARAVFGSVPGLLDARMPPAWFVEGYAVYLESKLTSGGRVRDSTTLSLRRALVRSGHFPSLADAGIGTLEEYPYGNTRYVFGAGFVNYLVERFGEDGLRRVIRQYNQTLTFADAWQGALGQSLEGVWQAWAAQETAEANAERSAAAATGLPSGEVLHVGSGVPAWQNSQRYAFMQGNSLRFASLRDGVEQLEPGFVTLPSRPNRLSFRTDGALVYSRLRASGATTIGELYRFQNGVETRLTTNAHARDAIAIGACILYVQESFERSSLRRYCAAGDTQVLVAPTGWHVFQPVVNAVGEIALTVWRPGGYLDIAVLRGSSLEFLTSDAAQDQSPSWLPDGRVLYSSDRSGSAQLYVMRPSERQTQRVSANPNGAFVSAVAPDGALCYSSYTGSGLETRRIAAWQPAAAEPLEFSEPEPLSNLDGSAYPLEPFSPNLAPVFWSPLTPNGIGATLYGVDQAGINSYQLALGYDLLTGTGMNASAAYSFAPRLDWSLNLSAGITSSGNWNLSLSAPFTGRAESLLTGRYSYALTPYLAWSRTGFSAGLAVRLDGLQSDVFGYLQRGWRLGLNLGSSGASATLTLADIVSGAPLVVTLRAVASGDASLSAGVQFQAQFSLGLHWRFPDGFIGLERLTALPFAALEWGAVPGYSLGVQVLLDLTLNYYVPLSLGAEISWNGNAWQLRLVTLIPLLEGLR